VLKRQSANLEMQFGSELVKLTNATDRRDAEQKAGLHLTRQEQAYGTAEECIAYVQRLIDAGADEIMFLIQMGTIPQEICLQTIRNIGAHVLPHFRGTTA
jgi:phospholipase/lecithinase/hemolysin